ncbi:endospore germination permease [Fodinisporobacter ferrooxydans]|uniref:Endospore germination permease n=1 Tax=Fodinisporobacter ferrooxydans TaxID=2901836 RepID=A0ABY4CJW5_9BACL|nr:endospore germination permease [Alicyclobacillaceae bacterium MYW30-H2]
MKRQEIALSPNLFFFLLLVFLFGSTTLLPIAPDVGHDAWISMCIAILLGILFDCIHAYVFNKFPGKSWVDIMKILYGNIVGTCIIILFIIICIFLVSYIIRDFEAFLTSVAYLRTPFSVIGVTYIVVVIYSVYHGIESIARCSIVIAFWMLLETLITTILLFTNLSAHPIRNFQPFFEKSTHDIVSGAIEIFTLPFGESILVWGIAHHVRNQKQLYKVSILATSIAGIIFLINVVRNTAVFGDLIGRLFYPTYEAVRYIMVADFIERIEILTLITWIAGGFIKMSIILYVAVHSMAKLFGLQAANRQLIPLGIFILILSMQVSANLSAYFAFIKFGWVPSSLLWQALFPLLTVLLVFFRFRKKEQKTG